eukprot:3340504-Heterocapsa_arctica.AAC.1
MAGPGPLTGPVRDHCRGNGLPKNSPPSLPASVVNTGAVIHLWDEVVAGRHGAQAGSGVQARRRQCV